MLFNVFYEWGGLNRQLFTVINDFRGPVVDSLMIAGTQLGDVLNAAWIALALLLIIVSHRVSEKICAVARFPDERVVSDVLFAFVVGSAISTLLVFAGKIGFDMPRPYDVLPVGRVNVVVAPDDPYSFPSGHSAFAVLVTWIFWSRCQKQWKAFLLLCVFWIGFSRVSVGAHFPSDVLGGYICGGVSGWLANIVLTNRCCGR